MIDRLKNLKISTKLTVLILTTVIGFAAFGTVAYSTITTIKVSGAMYDRISLFKALDADCAPPALYLIEARMDVLAFLLEKDPERVKEGIGLFEDQRKAFEDTYQSYLQKLPPGPVREQLTGDDYKEGTAWLQIVETRVIPAKQRGDEKGAESILADEARPHFIIHHKAGVDLAHATEAESAKQEDIARSIVSSRVRILVALGIVMLAIVVLLGWVTTRMILSSLRNTMVVLQAVAEGDLRDRVHIESQDESGIMGESLNRTLDKLTSTIAAIAENAQHVAAASEELSATSQQISANSEETSAQAQVVSQAAQQVNTNLQNVSTGSGEMTSTIQSIASNAHEAATVASNAVQTARSANSAVQKLGDSSAEIGEVIKVITSIAQQTNLLALNATIEAARAGEAGKGFAVVANEVKELAKQTAKATEDISRKIMAIQTDTKGAVEAIGSISGVIGQINDISGTIATAVEEQSVTTNEMTRNVADAATGSGEISRNIEGVAEAARGTLTSAQESQKAADELAEMAVQLRGLVGQFKIGTASVTTSPAPKSRSAQAGA